MKILRKIIIFMLVILIGSSVTSIVYKIFTSGENDIVEVEKIKADVKNYTFY